MDPSSQDSSALPYQPRHRLTEAHSVLIPISRVELAQIQTSANPLRTRPPSYATSAPSASTSTLPSLPSGLPQRPSAAAAPSNGHHDAKRPLPATATDGGQYKRKRPNEDVRAVADHYNARPNIGREARRDSPIIGLKNFNNWIKSVLIAKFGRRERDRSVPRVKVLDLGCGKGGDLQKWNKAGTDEYIGIDLAMVSVEQARSRWEELRGAKFQAAFFALDCYERSIADVFQPVHIERPFDVVSMQFCLHYAFESESKARMMLDNVTRYLRPGGVLIGTIPDSRNLLARLQELPDDGEPLRFGNSVYQVQFDELDPTPRFGHRYTFFLQDAVEEVPEYVVYWEEFEQLAREYGLELTYHEDFQQIFVNEREDAQFSELLTRMKVVDAGGDTEMTVDQWEAANLYVGFAFTKL